MKILKKILAIKKKYDIINLQCQPGGIGRRDRLKIYYQFGVRVRVPWLVPIKSYKAP